MHLLDLSADKQHKRHLSDEKRTSPSVRAQYYRDFITPRSSGDYKINYSGQRSMLVSIKVRCVVLLWGYEALYVWRETVFPAHYVNGDNELL